MPGHDTSLVWRLYHAALSRSPEERAAYLDTACGGDEALRREVELLLAESLGQELAAVRRAAAGLFGTRPVTSVGAPSAAFVGTARFDLRRYLGQGGFGTVYEVLDKERGVPVALKLLHATDPAALYHFKREFRTLADLTHPNLIALHELFSDEQRWFFTMELVHGRPIVEFVRDTRDAVEDGPVGDDVSTAADLDTGTRAREPRRSLDIARLRQTFARLADGLVAIHKQGIIHRDIKPSNVLVTAEGRVVVLDFGIATPFLPNDASVATIAGTPAYMAPEQISPDAVASPASDWYSVGVMLYEALTGKLPFSGTGLDLFIEKRTSPPAAADDTGVPDLMRLSRALLDPDPAKRPDSAEVRRGLSGERRTTEPIVVASAAASDLIGRDAHLGALAAAYDTARTGESVVVFIPGESGTGKSALLQRCIADLRRRRPSPVVLVARCDERESVPYKAVDGLVDGLAQYLRRLEAIEVARLLPREASLIARLFPVLLRVEEIDRGRSRVKAPADALELRRRAAVALRELLARLSDRAPLALVIDDLQWGDLDSGSLLQEIMRLPEPPALLLLVAYREEDAHAPLVRLLREGLLAQASRDVRTLRVDVLAPDQAFDLARRELSARVDLTLDRSAEIARESKGNVFFLHELARHALTVGGPVRLDTVIRDRLLALPDGAQRLLHAVAVSAQPIPAGVAAAAAGLDRDPDDGFGLLRAGRLIRTHELGERREFEPYHDRIRETIVAGLDPATLAGWHSRLAHAWEASGLARPETMVAHWHGAGNRVRTAEYARRAADAAEHALAFRRAAHYYRLLLEIEPSSERPKWYARLGDALANSGRGHDAARAYLDALQGAAPDAAIDLERRAAEQFIRAGYLSDAAAVIASLLPKVGVRPPVTELGAVIGLAARRAALALRGTGMREQREDAIPVEDLRRIDVLWSIGAPLSLVEPARGNDLHMRAMRLALGAGEPKRAVRALATLACTTAMGGTRHEARTLGMLAQARELSGRIGDPISVAQTALAEGMCQKVWGRWVIAREMLGRAIEQLIPCPGVRWEIETGRTMLHDTLFWLGDWPRLFAEIPGRRQEAEDYGDLYSATHVAVRLGAIAALAADDADRARAEAIRGMARWPSGHFDLQHRWEVCSLLEADLYTGRAREAWERLRLASPRLRWTLHVFQNARVEMRFFRARVALARAGGGERTFLNEAIKDAVRLEREAVQWAHALALLVRAAVAAASQDETAAVALEAAERELESAGMSHYSAAARYRRGQLVAGDEGRRLVDEGRRALLTRGIVDPEQMLSVLAPGVWPR